MIRYSRKYTALAISLVFFLAIGAPLVGAFFQEDKAVSTAEKRPLAQLPDLPADREGLQRFPGEFERYFNDQFGMRELFLRLFSRLKAGIGDTEISSAAEGQIPKENTVKGKDGWFFLNRVWDGDPISDYRNISLYSEADLLRATFLYAARSDWLKRHGARYLLFFAPNKHTVYSEYMPDYIVKQGDISSMDQLYDALSRYTSVEFVDLRGVLEAGKKTAHLYWKDHRDEAALYYKKDSHWNAAGADIVQYAVAERLAEMFPGRLAPRKRPKEDFTMMRFTGDISLIMGHDDQGAYGPHITEGRCSPATSKELAQRQVMTSCKSGELNALIFHDSFFTISLKAFFADYFARATFLWGSMNQKVFLEQSKLGKIDLVIEERAERFLPMMPSVREPYDAFWAAHFPHWHNLLFALGGKNVNTHLSAGKNTTLSRAADGSLEVQSTQGAPILLQDSIPFVREHLYMLRMTVESPVSGKMQIFFSGTAPDTPFPDRGNLYTVQVSTGKNTIYVPMFSGNLGGKLQIVFGSGEGEYRLRSLEIREVDISSFQYVR